MKNVINDDTQPLLPTHQSSNQHSSNCYSYLEGKVYSVIKCSLFCTGILGGGFATYEFLLPRISMTLSSYTIGGLGFIVCIVTCGGGLCLCYADPYRILQRALNLLPEQTQKLEEVNNKLCQENKALRETLEQSNQEKENFRQTLDQYKEINQESREDFGNKVGKFEKASDDLSERVKEAQTLVSSVNQKMDEFEQKKKEVQDLVMKKKKAAESPNSSSSHEEASDEEFFTTQQNLRELASTTLAAFTTSKE